MKNLSKKIIIGNWKMNLDYKSAITLSKKINTALRYYKQKNEVVLLPDFSSLFEVGQNIKRSSIKLGSQDVAPYNLGAYTGEVSLESLKQLKCEYVLIGHSERRQYFNDDDLIADKMKNVLDHSNIIPILCIGETLKQKRAGKTLVVLEKQLKTALSNIKNLSSKKIIIAYEPIWAIGSGRVIIVAEAISIHKKIRALIEKICHNNLPKELGIIYGGSINMKNFENFKNCSDISGLLIGGASLKANDFINIVNNF
ncbi:MAG TPA: triose-phosphate isomerase [bacterium]|nr:triose-phosphate isomerase [bacterium]